MKSKRTARNSNAQPPEHIAALRSAVTLANAFLWNGACPQFGSPQEAEVFMCVQKLENEHFDAKRINAAFQKAVKAKVPKFPDHDDIFSLANHRLTVGTQAAFMFGVAVGVRAAPLIMGEPADGKTKRRARGRR